MIDAKRLPLPLVSGAMSFILWTDVMRRGFGQLSWPSYSVATVMAVISAAQGFQFLRAMRDGKASWGVRLVSTMAMLLILALPVVVNLGIVVP